MMNFESDLSTQANTTYLPKGTPDMLDEWYAAQDDQDFGDHAEEMYDPDEPFGMTDVEADADTLASAGWGTDEDYGYFGDDFDAEPPF
jgi:hypothetical protein